MKQEMERCNCGADAVWDKLQRCEDALHAAGQVLEELKNDRALQHTRIEGLTNDGIRIGELAVMLNQNGVKIGQNQLFAWMRCNGYLLRQNCGQNLPTSKSIALGLMEPKRPHNAVAGEKGVCYKTPRVTPKGQQYFLEQFVLKRE